MHNYNGKGEKIYIEKSNNICLNCFNNKQHNIVIIYSDLESEIKITIDDE